MFARFVMRLLATVFCIWEIWSLCIHVSHISLLAKKKKKKNTRHRTNFEADRWPETADLFLGLTVSIIIICWCHYLAEVTKVLLFAAQSTHELVPPDIIETMVRTIVNNFVTERNSNEVMAVGWVHKVTWNLKMMSVGCQCFSLNSYFSQWRELSGILINSEVVVLKFWLQWLHHVCETLAHKNFPILRT